MWTQQISLLLTTRSNSRSQGALKVQEKGGKFGAKLTHRCGFWLDVPVKNTFRSHDWLELIWLKKKKKKVKEFKAI